MKLNQSCVRVRKTMITSPRNSIGVNVAAVYVTPTNVWYPLKDPSNDSRRMMLSITGPKAKWKGGREIWKQLHC